MYEKFRSKIPTLLAAIIITLISYFLTRFLASERVLSDLKNMGLTFFFSCLWLYFVAVYCNQKKYVICLWIIFAVLGLSVPIIGWLTSAHLLRLVIRDLLFYMALPLCILPVPLIFSNTGIRKICLGIFILATGTGLLVTSVICAYYFSAHAKLDADSFVAVLQTDWQETKEFFSAYFSIGECILFLILFFGILAVIYVLLRKICLNYNSDKSNKKLLVLVGIMCLSCGILFIQGYGISTFKEALRLRNDIASMKGNRESKLKKCEELVHKSGGNFALVIGETHTRTHMSAYGYERDTTPWLKKQYESGDTILLKNSFSCAALTQKALELALTEKSQYKYGNMPLSDAMTIIDLARHAGYRTVWITNQNSNTIARMIAMQADELLWVNKNRTIKDYWKLEDGGFDGQVMAELDSMEKQQQKTLYVIHLLGSHQVYKYRYPQEFAVWDEKEIINTYDNSLLYNDHIMGEMKKVLFEKFDVDGLIYFADHGEELKKYFHHGTDFFLNNYKDEPSVWDIVKIPIYMCFSEKYKKDHPQNIENLFKNQEKYFSNDMIYDTMLGIMDIKCQHYNPAQDISAGKYNFNKNTLRTMYGKVKITEID